VATGSHGAVAAARSASVGGDDRRRRSGVTRDPVTTGRSEDGTGASRADGPAAINCLSSRCNRLQRDSRCFRPIDQRTGSSAPHDQTAQKRLPSTVSAAILVAAVHYYASDYGSCRQHSLSHTTTRARSATAGSPCLTFGNAAAVPTPTIG